MTTKFISAEIPLQFGGVSLWIDGNSKITWDNGTYAKPSPNAFSIPHIATCPGSTARCRESCYIHGLKKAAPEIYRLYELNELALHYIFFTEGRMDIAAHTLAKWISANAKGGFRWHVSGDVTSIRHAEWIAAVCGKASEVPFWIYTRTLEAVETLVQAKNLAVNVSADRDNYRLAAHSAEVNGARLCYLVSEPEEVIPNLPLGSVIFPDYPLRGRMLIEPTDAP